MDSALPFNLDITNPDGNSFVTWILVTNDGRTQLDARPHGDALVNIQRSTGYIAYDSNCDLTSKKFPT